MKFTTNIQLGVLIANKRKKLGLTQTQLSEMCGINQKDISLIESGKSRPDIERLLPILSKLKLEMQLVDKETDKPTYTTSW
ncbi:MAG: transcriptional regulator with XRE-family HTH domain [Psychrosphaera sp.]|jgi:transcriptional regulator with XRE-family HTH domain|uniref:Helix-turn-helix domain-containing protein n=1 Tax=Psychrosphaera aquimarina TaxID=2044854 RepID=A0ABU3QYP4_9GAMM|nr:MULTISPECIES: helix-turn-helix domain-containing protein [Psychrosphaera]MBU2918089.1 helix-turn-helix domain-containing protein [Psychrosphaera sp. F3M07]MDU0112560.1 helix-turn-helix domain-containing protein [Psychrosphaera aquimarina]